MRVLALVVALAAACTPVAQTVPTGPPPASLLTATATPSTASRPTTSPGGSQIASVGEVVDTRSSIERLPYDAATEEQLAAVVAADSEFGFRLYRQIVSTETGDVFISPYSIATALSMVYPGARANTAQEMAAILGIGSEASEWHAGRNRLDLVMASAAAIRPNGGDATPLTIEPTNAIFGQLGYPFEPDFLDVLSANYGAGLHGVDFANATEAARNAVNQWTADRTHDRIEQILQPGSIDDLTRFVLVNAIYFKANWLRKFDPGLTSQTTFHQLDGSTVDVQMMHAEERLEYAEGDGWQGVRLPYWGASMVLIAPGEGRFADIEESVVSGGLLHEIEAEMSDHEVTLGVPQWESGSELELIPYLRELGMVDLFDPAVADLSGVAGPDQWLYISHVAHQANISVDENGTEAAAATAAVGELESRPPPATLLVDRPFIYLIQDKATGEILFLGRLTNPS
jgi:serpin B